MGIANVIAGKVVNAGIRGAEAVANNPGKAIAAGGVVGAASAANMVMDDKPKDEIVEPIGKGMVRWTVRSDTPHGASVIAQLKQFGEGTPDDKGNVVFTLSQAEAQRASQSMRGA